MLEQRHSAGNCVGDADLLQPPSASPQRLLDGALLFDVPGPLPEGPLPVLGQELFVFRHGSPRRRQFVSAVRPVRSIRKSRSADQGAPVRSAPWGWPMAQDVVVAADPRPGGADHPSLRDRRTTPGSHRTIPETEPSPATKGRAIAPAPVR